MANTFHIPEQPHDPPISHNPLFDMFKQDFGDRISSNKMIYLEFSCVFMIIKTYKQLHEWVENQQKTQSMIRIFESKDNDNFIKTFNNKNTPQQLKYQGKISNYKNSQYQNLGAIPKQYSQNNNFSNKNPNNRQIQDQSNRQFQGQSNRQTQSQSNRQTQSQSNRQIQGQSNRQIQGQSNRQIQGQSNRQIQGQSNQRQTQGQQINGQ